jgi:hypothetical protein
MEIEMDTSARTTDALDTASEQPLPLPGTEAYESLPRKRSINHIRQDNVCFQEAGAGEQFHGSSAS